MDTGLDMDRREKRGIEIARTKRIKEANGLFLVPSQSHSGTYVVDATQGTCSCPDHELRGSTVKCKHRWAVEYTRHRVKLPNGDTVETETVRVTYSQDWSHYNEAQCVEKEYVQRLLRGLCDGIVQPPYKGGRPRMPLADAIYGCTMKVYGGMSGRRSTTDIRACADAGHMKKAPHYNSLFNYVESAEVTPLLKALVAESASPLAAIETHFAPDGTGFSSTTYNRWFDHKYGREVKEAQWVKLNANVGTMTNVITSAIVTDGNEHDSPHLPALVEETAKRFTMARVSADKGYIGSENLEAIEAVGAIPYIPFRSNCQGEGSEAWRRMWHLYSFKKEEFLTHYHQRSNVESTFSALKRKFGPSVRSRLFTAQCNEVYLKCLAYNLTVLVHSIFELGIDASFWRSPPPPPPPPPPPQRRMPS